MLTESEKERQVLFEINKERLEQLAFRAESKGLYPDEYLVICIDVDDPTWSFVVDALMPNEDWQAIRDQGLKPVSRGIVYSEIRELLARTVPDVASILQDGNEIPFGKALAAVLGGGGVTIYPIDIISPFENN
ncbi:hypothetical protein COT75_03125 [Candidatus Beckwithbacteria bacterium CG10_big_fil_rev_8_21_14_0_10_34_10]|uniref:Uncharacterized protein n=1 Tax=Candidatus Beckwithbacteria bacterium CG10_big_fil_rev_8_21_14_0_10_34_10 TaxID=1974495 RepID=A0A2H0W8X4_9BACT|nr:MAG: hypothetical protein COT75_03125 [Candidatus Beckwithbacteria bacterium CG10_big_fil_rev_8_21_14_0_10_34_10]